MHHPDIGEFLFQLPPHPLTREEKLRRIKEAVESGAGMSQERLDQVMARLLEEIQRDD